MTTMNLTTDPWIPVVQTNGERKLVSLRQLFAEAGELRDLAVKPHERVALMRLLICITQAALDGPADEEEWEVCRAQIQPRVDRYLNDWQAAFELFGNGTRFLQFANLQPQKDDGEGNAATKLDLTLATGNNSSHFDNLAPEQRSLASARAALSLLTFQCFAPGGRIGVALWNGKPTGGNGSSNHAPCTPSSMVHTLVVGENILDSLHRNLLTKEIVSVSLTGGWGKAIWETPVSSLDDRVPVQNATASYLGRLVPISRAIRLDEAGTTMILANGIEYPIFPAFREATATVIKRKDELALLPASTSRSLWRQLGAVTAKRRADADQTCGPLALQHEFGGKYSTLWVGALVTDKAKIEDVVESVYTVPAELFSAFGRAAYEKGIEFAEEREGALIQAVKIYASSLKVVAPAYNRARQHYWTAVELDLSSLFALARDPDQVVDLEASAWGKSVRAAALDSYRRTCPAQTPRQIEAFARGLKKLNFPAKKQKEPVTADHD